MSLGNLAGFDANDHEDTNREALPAGWYSMVVHDTEMKPTKAGNGTLLEIVLRCTDGEYKGRQAWGRINMKNPSTTCVEMGQKELASLCRACDVLKPRDSTEFHGKRISVLLACGEWNGEITNDVKKYKKLLKVAAPVAVNAAPVDAESDPFA